VGFKAKELLHMSISDDPRGFRRGQSNNHPASDGGRSDPRQPARPDPRGNGARQGFQPRQDDQYGSFADGAGDYAERPAPAPAAQRQPSFSAFRPEAYAEPEKDWRQQDARPADKRPAPRPQPARAHDPYADVSSDPYDADRHDYGNDWNSDSFQAQQPNQFAASNYYPQHDDPNPAEAQSVHNRFFSAEPEPAPAPKPAPAPQAQRYRQQDDYPAHDYEPEPQPPARAPKPAPSNSAPKGGYDDGNGGYRWDNFDQAPAPESIRPFANASLGSPARHQEDELDADYFADEDEFDGEDDYAEPKRGGGKKLMAAVLMGAVVTGGGLAYLYKSQTNGGASGEPPIMTADARPIKQAPSDPGGREFPNGSKLIYDRLDGASASGGLGAEEPTRVASRDESNSDGGVPGVVTTGASGTLEERIQNALQNAKRQDDTPSQGAASAPAASPDEPRRVRTEIFRPDGSTEGNRPQRRQAPAEETALASGGSAPAARGASREAAPPAASRSVGTQQIAALTPPAPQTAITTGGESGMFVQIAARNDEAAARAAFADLQQKYAGVLGSHSPSVRKVDLGEKGVWYRLLVGPMASKGDADKLCEDLKTAGMKGCFSRKE
jgi:hypothetical protein